MARAKITTDEYGDVTVECDNDQDDGRTATTYCLVGNSVRIRTGGSEFPQVCEHLAPLGPTLTSTRAGLPALIRREFRKAQAWDRRFYRRD